MKLRGIEFGSVLGAAGVQGVFGEGYRHHKLLNAFGLGPNFTDCTFVSKTTTLDARLGNMPMKKDGITPKEIVPKCIKTYFTKGIMLNAVGLSGPGARRLLNTGRWQGITKPFFISFMALGKTQLERIHELRLFIDMLKSYMRGFSAPFGLQINLSCPNVGLHLSTLTSDARNTLLHASALKVPLMLKFNALVSVADVKEIAADERCDAICVSNTIPWGQLPDKIDWKKLFGTDVSPLAKYGGGGLSGKPLLPIVTDWVRRARDIGITKPINAGGGILYPDDVDTLYNAGASSVFIGSVATLRPWRAQGIIQRAHKLFKDHS